MVICIETGIRICWLRYDSFGIPLERKVVITLKQFSYFFLFHFRCSLQMFSFVALAGGAVWPIKKNERKHTKKKEKRKQERKVFRRHLTARNEVHSGAIFLLLHETENLRQVSKERREEEKRKKS